MKAIALLSGGLDSTLAVKVMLEQGVELTAVNFVSPFCLCNHKGCIGEARKVADHFGIRLEVFHVADEYLEIVKAPKFGYGKNLNPCIDCRILMNKKAGQYMREVGAKFIVTGEVLGQRPMSQHRAAMDIIERESGLKGLILRPLSAKLLPVTIPEENGWVDRNKLLNISGRSRKEQIRMAEEYSISDYPCPAGGCLLTDIGFNRRLKDLIKYDELSLKNINLLKIGRHFRLRAEAKLVIGRDEHENNRIDRLFERDDMYFAPLEVKGPIAIGRGMFGKKDIITASRMIARYCDGHDKSELKISNYIYPDGEKVIISVKCMDESRLQELRV